MAAKIITCSGEVINLELGTVPLALAQGIVGGTVEMVHIDIRLQCPDTGQTIKGQMLVNENGLGLRLDRNPLVSNIANQQIVGVVLILSGKHLWN